jgi:hypothetical protein
MVDRLEPGTGLSFVNSVYLAKKSWIAKFEGRGERKLRVER